MLRQARRGARAKLASAPASAIAQLAAPRPEVGARITLGRKVYTVTRSTELGLELAGPRGGRTDLVQNKPNPAKWCHMIGNRGTWYHWNGEQFVELIG